MNKKGLTPTPIGISSGYNQLVWGLTLMEILVSTLIISLTLIGLANIFVAGKRYVLHSRSRMTGGELGKYFLDPLQMSVKQSDWNNATNDYATSNPLHQRTNEQGTLVTLDRTYTPFYTVDIPPGLTDSQMRRVKVTIQWTETTP